ISLNSSGNLNLSSKDTIASYGIYNNSSGGKATLSLKESTPYILLLLFPIVFISIFSLTLISIFELPPVA
ncbi:hypothetical protein, partial [Fusobacterium mortiferum]|uniref:hypothetical protein n=1 Tax=Fusobacterium mortiferum TaxID=850 RepID=UPI0019590E8D